MRLVQCHAENVAIHWKNQDRYYRFKVAKHTVTANRISTLHFVYQSEHIFEGRLLPTAEANTSSASTTNISMENPVAVLEAHFKANVNFPYEKFHMQHTHDYRKQEHRFCENGDRLSVNG